MLHPVCTAPFAGVLTVLLSLPLAAQEDARSSTPPEFQFVPQDEDWSRYAPLEDGSSPLHWSAPYKHIPLSADGRTWLSLGGSARARLESWNNFNFGNSAGVDDDDVFVVTRARVHGDLHVGSAARVFMELKSAQATDRSLAGGRRALDLDTLALHQLFFEHRFERGENALTVRPGRQMLRFGRQRLVSTQIWANTLRTWDGVSAVWDTPDWRTTAFWAEFVPVDKTGSNSSDSGNQLFGVYAARRPQPGRLELDAYLLGSDQKNRVFNGTAGDDERYTLGSRVGGAIAGTGFDFDLEGAYQFGEIGTGDISAYMVGAELGYSFTESDLEPRVWLGLDYATGDESPGGDVETFNHLFPLGHGYLGYVDTFGRQNVLDLSTGATARVSSDLSLRLAHHFLWLADADDALYNPGGAATLPGGTSRSRTVGSELDLRASYRFSRYTSATVGYSHFFAGSVPEAGGPGEDVDLAYVSLQYRF